MKLNRFDHLLKIKKETRYCDHVGCDQPGYFRAPRNRNALRELDPANLDHYHSFCEKHVRAYNLQWNYYAGMNGDEILQHRYRDIVWQRPTWPIGKAQGNTSPIHENVKSFAEYKLFFAFHMAEEPEDSSGAESFPIHSEESRALRTLNIKQPTTLDTVKRIYKEKAKRYHPDINGNCRAAEEKLKEVNQAYHVLKKAFGRS